MVPCSQPTMVMEWAVKMSSAALKSGSGFRFGAMSERSRRCLDRDAERVEADATNPVMLVFLAGTAGDHGRKQHDAHGANEKGYLATHQLVLRLSTGAGTITGQP